MNKIEKLLEISSLTSVLSSKTRTSYVMNDGNFIINKGSSIGVIGESGSGKTELLKTIIGTQEMIPGIIKGSVKYHINNKEYSMYINDNGQYRLDDINDEIKKNLIGFIPQEPKSFLNPFWTIKQLFKQTYELKKKKRNLHQFIYDYLKLVGLPTTEEFINKKPGKLSGGQAQRVMVALVLSKEPELIIADESTTGLDVSNQKLVIDSFKKIRSSKPDVTMIFISHVVDEYYVLYGGFICEHITDQKQFFNLETLHPYTQDLISSLQPDTENSKELSASADLTRELSGCSYYKECIYKDSDNKLKKKCNNEIPPIINTDSGNKKNNLSLKWQRCWLRDE